MPDGGRGVQCSVFIATSLDGFIARADGGIDWLSVVERPDEDYGYQRFCDSVDVFVVGRKTYETALGFESWPYAGKRCIVMTHGTFAPRHGEELYAGPPEGLVARLSATNARRAYVDGGDVIRQFLAAGLIEDLTLSIIPVLLGEGVRLFGKTGRDVPLALVRTGAFESGLVQLAYRRP
jgi:dihydrofolate reductase